jgi:hypothetical protein
LHAKISANESSAVGSLRSYNTVCANYASTYGQGFPPALANLGPAAIPSAAAADLLDSVLTLGVKSRYTFTFSAGPVVNKTISMYSITAEPVTRGSSGQRGFYTDQKLTIHVNATGPASSSDPSI